MSASLFASFEHVSVTVGSERNESRPFWPAYAHKYKTSDQLTLPQCCSHPFQLATRQLARRNALFTATSTPPRLCQSLHHLQWCTTTALLFLNGHDILFRKLDITGDKNQLLCCFSNMLLAQPANPYTWDAAKIALMVR